MIRPTLRSLEESTLHSDCQERRHSIVEPSSGGSCYKRIPSVSSQLTLRDGSTPRVGPGRAESTSRPHSTHCALVSPTQDNPVQALRRPRSPQTAVFTNSPVSTSRGNRCRQQQACTVLRSMARSEGLAKGERSCRNSKTGSCDPGSTGNRGTPTSPAH